MAKLKPDINNYFSPVIILALFILTNFIYEDFGVRMIYGYGVLVGTLIIYLFLSLIKKDKVIIFSIFEKLYLGMMIVILLNIFRNDVKITYNLIV